MLVTLVVYDIMKGTIATPIYIYTPTPSLRAFFMISVTCEAFSERDSEDPYARHDKALALHPTNRAKALFCLRSGR